MKINDIYFNCSLNEILEELRRQLAINQIHLLDRMIDGSTDVQICCPYHNDRRPSAGITKIEKKKNNRIIPAGTFFCFTCHETHTLPEFISFCFGYHDDMIGAFGWKWLCRNFLTVSVENREIMTYDFSRGKKKQEEMTYVSEEELDKYRYYHPYWAKRGITDDNIIEMFDLGWDETTDCITMPNLDKDGNCLFVARRSVKTKWFNYPSNVTKGLYGIYQLYQLPQFPKTIWITESMIDSLRLWQLDRPCLALNGVGDYNQYKQISKLPCREIVLATDMDKAGQDARVKFKQNVKNKLILEVFLPKGRKDIGDCTDDEIIELQPQIC